MTLVTMSTCKLNVPLTESLQFVQYINLCVDSDDNQDCSVFQTVIKCILQGNHNYLVAISLK